MTIFVLLFYSWRCSWFITSGRWCRNNFKVLSRFLLPFVTNSSGINSQLSSEESFPSLARQISHWSLWFNKHLSRWLRILCLVWYQPSPIISPTVSLWVVISHLSFGEEGEVRLINYYSMLVLLRWQLSLRISLWCQLLFSPQLLLHQRFDVWSKKSWKSYPWLRNKWMSFKDWNNTWTNWLLLLNRVTTKMSLQMDIGAHFELSLQS